MSQAGTHPVVSNMGHLDWESSMLTTTGFGFENNWLEAYNFNKWIFVGVLFSTAESYIWRCSEINCSKFFMTPRKHSWWSFFSQVESFELKNYQLVTILQIKCMVRRLQVLSTLQQSKKCVVDLISLEWLCISKHFNNNLAHSFLQGCNCHFSEGPPPFSRYPPSFWSKFRKLSPLSESHPNCCM